MDYELALELKNAGFPQDGDSGAIVHAPGCDWKTVPCAQPHKPTLEELIEACGSDLLYINNNVHEWKALGTQQEFGRGLTSTEAVAKLWLDLNK